MIRILCATNECTTLAAELAAVRAECDALARALVKARDGKAFYEALYREATNAQGMARSAHRKGVEGREG